MFSLVFAQTCLAYVGPGPGLSLTWALVGLIVTIVAALFAVLLWPFRMMLRKIRGGDGEESEASEQSEDAEESADSEE